MVISCIYKSLNLYRLVEEAETEEKISELVTFLTRWTGFVTLTIFIISIPFYTQNNTFVSTFGDFKVSKDCRDSRFLEDCCFAAIVVVLPMAVCFICDFAYDYVRRDERLDILLLLLGLVVSVRLLCVLIIYFLFHPHPPQFDSFQVVFTSRFAVATLFQCCISLVIR